LELLERHLVQVNARGGEFGFDKKLRTVTTSCDPRLAVAMSTAEELKAEGNKKYADKEYIQAIALYAKAIGAFIPPLIPCNYIPPFFFSNPSEVQRAYCLKERNVATK
jgi:hypothetical protein